MTFPKHKKTEKRSSTATKSGNGATPKRASKKPLFTTGSDRSTGGNEPPTRRKARAHEGEPKADERRKGAGAKTERSRGTSRKTSEPRAEGRKPDARREERPARGARSERKGASAERPASGSRKGASAERPASDSRFAARKGASAERPASGSRFATRKGAPAERPASGSRFAARKGASAERPASGSRFAARKGASAERPASGSRFAARKGASSERSGSAAFDPRKSGRSGRPASTSFDPRKTGRAERPAASSKFDGRKSRVRKDVSPRAEAPSREGARGHSAKASPRSHGARGRTEFASNERVRVYVPQTPTPSALVRTTKPLERKRPDLSEEPHPGHFLITTREGSEQDVVDELMLAGVVDPPPRILAPALVLAPKVPRNDKRPIELAFARQGFPIVQSVHAHDLEEISQRISRSLRGQLEKANEYALHVWVPDSDLGNPLAAMATALEERITAQLATSLPNAKRVDDSALRRLGSMLFAQVCLIDPERAVAGVTYSNAALSLARGGRTRVRVTGHFPSRAARKLEEALAWLGVEPGAGELCVDLGAAPGGWTYVLADRRARVIAVDPANLKPEILAMKGVRHVKESAFNYKPDAEVDWLFCDMAWRPLEAAALLAKWGRNRWARMVVANIKLPMTKKAEIVARVRHILAAEGDWKHIRVKQLYHDRDEITLSAHVG